MPLDESGGYPRTMALDLGKWIGYAVGTSPFDLTWGDFPLAEPDRLDVAPIGEKAANFADGLNGLLAEHSPERLVFEAPFFGDNTNYGAGEQQIGLFWQAQAIAWVASCSVTKHHVNTVRAKMGVKVPRGEDPKPLVMRHLHALGYRKIYSDHQGDALLLWLFQWSLLTQTTPPNLKRMLVPA